MSEDVIFCPCCKGKGHVFFALLLINPITWLLAPFERNDINGLTRCP